MGNLFDEFFELGKEEGIERGIEKGIERGIETVISMGQDFGLSRQEIIAKIQEMAGVDKEKAQEYYDRNVKECV